MPFVIQNKDGWYWAKKDHWVSGREPHEVFFAEHYDHALNHMIEKTLKDASQRCRVLEVELSEKRRLLLDIVAANVAAEEERRAFELQNSGGDHGVADDAQLPSGSVESGR